MSTQAQVAANQANAQHSTGPRTEAGKAACALNNFRHGFTGVFRVLSWESKEEFDALHAALRDEHRPSSLTETILIDKMAQALWLSKRAAWMQYEILNDVEPKCDNPKQLALYIRYQTTNDRGFHKSLNDFLKLRAEKRKQEIGFESQQQKKAEQLRKDTAENRRQELHTWRVLLAQAQLNRRSQSAIMSQSGIRDQNPLRAAAEMPVSSTI